MRPEQTKVLQISYTLTTDTLLLLDFPELIFVSEELGEETSTVSSASYWGAPAYEKKGIS